MTGRTALITGSTRGIGRAIAFALAEAGADVIIHGSREGELLHQTVEELNTNGLKAVGIPADIFCSEAVAELVGQAVEKLHKIDILVLNASIQIYQDIDAVTEIAFLEQLNTNLRSIFDFIRLTVPGMRQRGWGRILSIGSVNQWKPSPNLPVYAAAKAAQVNLVMNLAKQFAPDGVTVNNLAPGVILTDRNKQVLADMEFEQKILKMIPAGHFGQSEDCAGLALLLCSEAGRYITGADIPVTGGMHL